MIVSPTPAVAPSFSSIPRPGLRVLPRMRSARARVLRRGHVVAGLSDKPRQPSCLRVGAPGGPARAGTPAASPLRRRNPALPALREQDRILGELDSVNRRIGAHHDEYADARAHLDNGLNLHPNCADIYNRCDDATRHLCNQSFFAKVYIDEGDELRIENNRPSRCSSTPRSTPTPSPGPRTPTRPEPQPTIFLARVRALCVGWS